MKKLLTRSLIARLVTSFLLVAILAVSLIGYTAYRLGSESIQEAVIAQLSVAASLKEAELNRWVDDQRQEVQVLAASPIIRLAGADALLRSAPGTQSYTDAYKILSTYLPAIVLNKATLNEIFILSNTGGEIIYSTDRNREGEFRLADSYFVRGKRGIVVENVYPSPLTLRPAMTIAAPLFDAEGKQFGVLAAHINLDRLDQILLDQSLFGLNRETYLVDRFNDFVSGQRFGRSDFPRGVHTVGIDAAVRGEDGAALYTNYAGKPVVGVYRWVEKRDFALITEVAQSEAFAPARRLAWTVLGVGFVLVLMIALLIYVLTRQIVKPVTALTQAAQQVARGDLYVQSPISTRDEIGVLARTFNRMTEQLRQSRDTLEEEVASRTQELRQTNQRLQALATELSEKNSHLQQGLALAHDIQLGLLPDSPPWDASVLVAHGCSIPSAEVGGDFYNFIALRETWRVGVAIGDISGKGVGAALMMALTSSTLEERAREVNAPAALLNALNERLLSRLRANNMNAALQYLMFDIKRSSLRVANAGMISPLLLRNGAVSYIEAYGLPLGSIKGLRYSDVETSLSPGDILLLLSDGVVEARNERDEMLGFERVEELFIESAAQKSPEQALNHMVREIASFMGTAEQHDDITLVWLQV